MTRALRQLAVTGGALLLPLFASAHNGEWLLAKLTTHAAGGVTLTVTVDAEANFLIKDRTALVHEAKELLLLNDGKETRPWSEVAPAPTFGTTDHLDPAAPLGQTPEELARRYTLLQATWRWEDAPARFTLLSPEKSPHTVILWLDDERRTKGEPRWVMLIGGDESPLIDATPGTREGRTGRILALVAWFALSLVAAFGVRKMVARRTA